MTDLLAWLAEHGTTAVALAAALTSMARARAVRDEAASQAVAAVVDELGRRKKAHKACEDRCAQLEGRMLAAEKAAKAADARALAAVTELRRHIGGKEHES